MGRRPLHDPERILDAVRDIVIADGVRAATVERVVTVTGVPKGSIYHRFASADELVAVAWLRAVDRSQHAALAALGDGRVTVTEAVACGLSLFDFAREHTADARLLAALSAPRLRAEPVDPRLAHRLEASRETVRDLVRRVAIDLYGSPGDGHAERAWLALVDLPLGVIRRHLLQGRAAPVGSRPILEAAIRAALAVPAAPPTR